MEMPAERSEMSADYNEIYAECIEINAERIEKAHNCTVKAAGLKSFVCDGKVFKKNITNAVINPSALFKRGRGGRLF